MKFGPSFLFVMKKNEITNEIYVPVSLDILIEKIFVSPKAPKWFLDLVRSILIKYGLDKRSNSIGSI